MAILDIIEFLDPSGEIIVKKIPQDREIPPERASGWDRLKGESGAFRLGSQLVVQESQVAVFFRDGQALDVFGPGRRTLSTQNSPLLGKLIGAPFGGKSPFRCYVYFVATKTFINMGWGTQSPVLFRDADFRMLSLRAHGVYSIRIVKPRTFLNSVVGTKGMEYTYDVRDFFRSVIVSRLNEVLGSEMKSILDLPVQYNTITLKTKEAVAADFEQYGVQLIDLLVQAITPPPEVQDMINRASGVAAQDTEKYKAIATADAMRDAAKNPGGTAGVGLGAGMGLGMGLGMAQQVTQSMNQPRVQPESPSTPGARLSALDVKEKLRELKEMKDEGLISDSDFEEQKKRLLSAM